MFDLPKKNYRTEKKKKKRKMRRDGGVVGCGEGEWGNIRLEEKVPSIQAVSFQGHSPTTESILPSFEKGREEEKKKKSNV